MTRVLSIAGGLAIGELLIFAGNHLNPHGANVAPDSAAGRRRCRRDAGSLLALAPAGGLGLLDPFNPWGLLGPIALGLLAAAAYRSYRQSRDGEPGENSLCGANHCHTRLKCARSRTPLSGPPHHGHCGRSPPAAEAERYAFPDGESGLDVGHRSRVLEWMRLRHREFAVGLRDFRRPGSARFPAARPGMCGSPPASRRRGRRRHPAIPVGFRRPAPPAPSAPPGFARRAAPHGAA